MRCMRRGDSESARGGKGRAVALHELRRRQLLERGRITHFWRFALSPRDSDLYRGQDMIVAPPPHAEARRLTTTAPTCAGASRLPQSSSLELVAEPARVVDVLEPRRRKAVEGAAADGKGEQIPQLKAIAVVPGHRFALFLVGDGGDGALHLHPLNLPPVLGVAKDRY